MALFIFWIGGLAAQNIWGYNFGTGSTSFVTPNSNTTTFFTNPAIPSGGGTYRLRTSTSGGGGFYRDDPGISSLGSDTELRIQAPTTSGTGGINKFAVYGYTRQRNAYYRTTMRFGNSTGGFADSGTFYFFFGDGTSFEGDNPILNTEANVGIRWVLGANGTITTSYMNAGAWQTLPGYTFAQGVNYTVEYRMHMGPGNAGSGKTYTYNGTQYITTIYTYDIWINGTRIPGLLSAGLGQNKWLDSFAYYAESSVGNVGNLFLDDSSYTNAIDVTNAPIYYSKSTGSLHTLATWGMNTDGSGTSPTNFTSPSIGYYIRNNAAPTITANWAVSGSAARVELGDGINACTFTVPSGFTYTGPIDVNNNGTLNLQNTVYPSIGLLNTGSTVRYSSSGAQNVLGLNYHNLSIRGTGEKTLNNAAFATNLVDVGDGTNAVTFTIPQAYPLTGTVTVLNNGTLNIQNLVNPTLGTLNSGSTVIYSALANQSVVGANYHNLNIRGTGNKTLAGNATAGGLVSVGDGTNAVTLTVPTAYTLAGTVNVATNATLDIHNVTLPTLGTLATGSTVRYSYAGDQNVTGTTYYNMDVDNGFTKTMQNDVTVTNLAFANNGTLALNNYNLYLAGKDISFYSPNAVFSQLSVTLTNDQIAGLSINRVWSTYGSFTNNVAITFRYPDTESNATTIGGWYRDDSGIWTKAGTFTATANGGYMYVTIPNITTIGSQAKGPIKWTFAQDDQTLPVELASFTAQLTVNNYVQLMWITHSETNLSGYNIYRGTSADLTAAERLNVFIPGTNTSQTQSYVFMDEEIFNDGIYYYWLANLNFDGSTEYHGPVMLDYNISGNNNNTPNPAVLGISRLYPNPFNPVLNIEYGVTSRANVKLDIFNTRGQLVRAWDLGSLDTGNYTLRWDGTDALNQPVSSGVYLIRFQSGYKTVVKQAVLTK